MLLAVATFIVAAAALVALWRLCIWMPGTSYAGVLEPLTAEEQAAAQRLEADVRKLAADIGERSIARPAGLTEAAAYVEGVFRDLGYTVTSHAYESRGQWVRNVEATLNGTERRRDIVLVGAHYDSVMGTTGANDNATGVAAMLELARRFAKQPSSRTLRFVAFVNEEPPFFDVGEMGSQYYAAAAARRGDAVAAMLSLETLGYYSDAAGSQQYPFPFGLFYPSRGNFVAFVGNLRSRALVHRGVAAFRAHARFASEGVAAPEWIPGVSWSDHASFWDQGYAAIMITDTAPYRYPYYHTEQDVPEHVNYARLARVVTGISAVVADLAR